MQAEHINPFLRAVSNTFTTMFNCEARRGAMTLVDSAVKSYPISGVIGLSGKAAGTVVINLSEEVALKAASAMLMMEMTEVDDDVIDAVGEMANLIASDCGASESRARRVRPERQSAQRCYRAGPRIAFSLERKTHRGRLRHRFRTPASGSWSRTDASDCLKSYQLAAATTNATVKAFSSSPVEIADAIY